MQLDEVEANVRSVCTEADPDSFLFELMLAYGLPKASITRLQKGDYNLAKSEADVLWKKRVFFRTASDQDLHELIDGMQSDEESMKRQPRFLITTDYKRLVAIDVKTSDTLDTPFTDLPDHFDFFLPWAGMEKSQIQSEALADIKAAEKMGLLYEVILAANPVTTNTERHALNIFLSRLLFCFFAEDTGIFDPDNTQANQFTNAIASHTQDDGSDLQDYLQQLFDVLATEDLSLIHI